jgi:hypothetical protein
MSGDRKGIVDPWRQVEPLRPTLRERPEGKKDLDDIDLDADLVLPGKYVVRVKGAALDVTSTRVETPKDALDVIADCLMDLWRIKAMGKALMALDIGVRTRRGMYNVPDEHTPTSKLESANSAIWFGGTSLEEGVAALVRLMRSSDAQPIVKKHGITPMLTA